MLKNCHVFWILIFHSCNESTILAATTSPVQTFVGWNASFNIQLNPYPSNDSLIQIAKNGTLLMLVKGTHGQGVAERFEFTGNTFENQISFILRNVTIGDAGTYYATVSGLSSRGEQILIVKVAPSKPEIVAITGSAVLGSDYRLNCSSVSNSAAPDHGLTMMSEWKVNDQLITAGGSYKVQETELTIASLTRQDNNDRLTCVTYEDSLAKSIPSNELVIDVMYGPGNSVNLGSNPSTLIVYLHQRAPDITCSATCNPPCNYRWYHNKTLYSIGATLSLGVVANKTSGGNYTCEAFNGLLSSEGPSSTSVSIHVYSVGRELEVKGGANVAAIAGGIGAAVVVVVILVVLFFIWRKKTSMLKNSSDEGFSNSVQGRSNQTANLYANTSFSGDVSNTGYESLQACKTEASPYLTLSSGDTETSDQNKDCSESMTIRSAGAGKIYMNIAITSPLSDKEYESLQSNQIETNQYQVLNDRSQPNNIRLSAGDNQLNPYYNVRQAAL